MEKAFSPSKLDPLRYYLKELAGDWSVCVVLVKFFQKKVSLFHFLQDEGRSPDRKKSASFSRRASISIRNQLRKEVRLDEVKQKEEEPVLEPGVIDYVCVLGAHNIGDQKSDDGASGWVNSSPESSVLEQFPPTTDYHVGNGRNVTLPDKIEWFCFPEGCRLWRGTTPPNAEELNLVRFSASSPANIATTIASFDACLGCTSSFSWFVLSSNSDSYGSANTKTYGACIRFFVPAPTGIDPTQDDFGQSIRGAALNDKASKRLWGAETAQACGWTSKPTQRYHEWSSAYA
jgi:hypothetical protein